MKAFRKLCVGCFIVFIAVTIGINAFLLYDNHTESREYRINENRLVAALEESSVDFQNEVMVNHWLAEQTDTGFMTSRYIVASSAATKQRIFFSKSERINNDYTIREIIHNTSVVGYLRMEYATNHDQTFTKEIVMVNICMVICALTIIVLLILLRQKILKPFWRLSEAPYELAKGHLRLNLKEQRGSYFGKFVWGMDLLRNSLSDAKTHEMELEREKKLMVLSISHDIKTPLSAIRLYSKALQENLYKDPKKRQEVLVKIDEKAVQIETMVSQLTDTSTDQKKKFTYEVTEFYLTEVIRLLSAEYRETCELAHMNFDIGVCPELLVRGDLDRLVEVFENLMENAMKYGDGLSVRFEYTEEDGFCLVHVINSGEPIESSHFVHLFENFWRGENAVDKPGSGLGLHIAKIIMNEIGGEIYAETVSEHEMGFVVVIPYA